MREIWSAVLKAIYKEQILHLLYIKSNNNIRDKEVSNVKQQAAKSEQIRKQPYQKAVKQPLRHWETLLYTR